MTLVTHCPYGEQRRYKRACSPLSVATKRSTNTPCARICVSVYCLVRPSVRSPRIENGVRIFRFDVRLVFFSVFVCVSAGLALNFHAYQHERTAELNLVWFSHKTTYTDKHLLPHTVRRHRVRSLLASCAHAIRDSIRFRVCMCVCVSLISATCTTMLAGLRTRSQRSLNRINTNARQSRISHRLIAAAVVRAKTSPAAARTIHNNV